MSPTDHRAMSERAMCAFERDARTHEGQAEKTVQCSSGISTRVQAIHELVCTGDYHVPAAAIADCIVERIIGSKRGSES